MLCIPPQEVRKRFCIIVMAVFFNLKALVGVGMLGDTDLNGRFKMILFLLFVMLSYIGLAQAKSNRASSSSASMTINISGTIVSNASCTFNAGSGATLAVNFGDINYTTTNGFSLDGEYRETLSSAMTCTGNPSGEAIFYFASGDGSVISYNNHNLIPVTLDGVKSSNLAIQLIVNDEVHDIGSSPISFDLSSPPKLEVELVQTGTTDVVNNGAQLTASGTLIMAFQ